jgi:hypothetical protein
VELPVRYYFHVKDGVDSLDEVGSEFADFELVRCELLRFTGELLSQASPNFWDHAPWMVWVTDTSGTTVLSVNISAEVAKSELKSD